MLRTTPLAYGLAVALSLMPSDAEGGPWTMLAYEVELKGYRLADGSHARITERDIDEMIANFSAYPKVPLVIEHADTREAVAKVHPEWATPQGHIVALRKGSMTRVVNGAVRVVATLEGRIEASPEVRLSITGDAVRGVPPTWPFCSITPASGRDEESGQDLGAVLWSVSLTSHPRLADLPRLAAAQEPSALAAAHPPEKTMTFLELAATLKLIAVATEEAAQSAVLDLARDGAAVRETLTLAADKPVAPAIADLVAARAELGQIKPKYEALQTVEAARSKAERERYVGDLCLARGWDADVKSAMEFSAHADFPGFQKKYPAPSREELAQRAQDAARTGALPTTADGEKPAELAVTNDAEALRVNIVALRELAQRAGVEMTTVEALALTRGGVTPAAYAKELGLSA
mgnify:CR=1 FL=1